MQYEELDFKIPVESPSYPSDSEFVVQQIRTVLQTRIASGENCVFLNTNLRQGLPLENINKIAGPMLEAWVFEVFWDVLENPANAYRLIHAEAQPRLGMSDIVLQFQKTELQFLTGNVDVKATAEDIPQAGKAPNITSFSRIRTAYVEDPDFLFVILSIKYRAYSRRNVQAATLEGILEVVDCNACDLKYLSERDLIYNPALGTGQLQIRDIHYVTPCVRTTWEFCQMIDKKFLNSSKRTLEDWLAEARRNHWIKEDEPEVR